MKKFLRKIYKNKSKPKAINLKNVFYVMSAFILIILCIFIFWPENTSPKVYVSEDDGAILTDQCEKEKYICTDFKTRTEAQDTLENCGGRAGAGAKTSDVGELDSDNNGLACENLPIAI